jgi:multidrug efflux pump subunit AcrA (membrane-fusion protein)
VLDRRAQVLSIPIEAVPDRKGHAASVYVLDDRHRVERRDLTLGLETATRIEVVSGLRDGDLVVLGGAGKLRPGEEVTPKLVAAPSPSP